MGNSMLSSNDQETLVSFKYCKICQFKKKIIFQQTSSLSWMFLNWKKKKKAKISLERLYALLL